MTISFVAAGTVRTGTGTSAQAYFPAGYQAGDLLLAILLLDTAPTITVPDGWTLVTNRSGVSNARLYQKIAVASEPTTTWSFSASARFALVLEAYRGQSQSAPIGASGNNAASGTTITGPTLTTPQDNMMLFWLGEGPFNNTSYAITVPSSLTGGTAGNLANASSYLSRFQLAHGIFATAGSITSAYRDGTSEISGGNLCLMAAIANPSIGNSLLLSL